VGRQRESALRFAARRKIEDQRHPDARTFNAWLAEADLWVDGDSVEQCHHAKQFNRTSAEAPTICDNGGPAKRDIRLIAQEKSLAINGFDITNSKRGKTRGGFYLVVASLSRPSR
jgi:hypothetical protein